MPCFELMLMVAAIVIAPMFVAVWMEQRAAARARMSDASPVCANCHYRVGAWSSSVCPECGRDIRRIGVRTGPRTADLIAAAAVVAVSLFGIGPLAYMVLSQIFTAADSSAQLRYLSTTLDGWYLRFETEYSWQRFPPDFDSESSLLFTQILEDKPGGTWYNGRYFGPAEHRTHEIKYNDRTGPPTASELRRAIEQVVPEGTAEPVVTAHVDAVMELVTLATDQQQHGLFRLHDLQVFESGPVKARGGGGSFGYREPGWAAMALTVIVVAVCLAVGLVVTGRFVRSGWRLPRANEWRELTPP